VILFDQFLIVVSAERPPHLVSLAGIKSGDIDGQLIDLVLKQNNTQRAL